MRRALLVPAAVFLTFAAFAVTGVLAQGQGEEHLLPGGDRAVYPGTEREQEAGVDRPVVRREALGMEPVGPAAIVEELGSGTDADPVASHPIVVPGSSWVTTAVRSTPPSVAAAGSPGAAARFADIEMGVEPPTLPRQFFRVTHNKGYLSRITDRALDGLRRALKR